MSGKGNKPGKGKPQQQGKQAKQKSGKQEGKSSKAPTTNDVLKREEKLQAVCAESNECHVRKLIFIPSSVMV